MIFLIKMIDLTNYEELDTFAKPNLPYTGDDVPIDWIYTHGICVTIIPETNSINNNNNFEKLFLEK